VYHLVHWRRHHWKRVCIDNRRQCIVIARKYLHEKHRLSVCRLRGSRCDTALQGRRTPNSSSYVARSRLAPLPSGAYSFLQTCSCQKMAYRYTLTNACTNARTVAQRRRAPSCCSSATSIQLANSRDLQQNFPLKYAI